MAKPRQVLSKKEMVNNSKVDLAVVRTLVTLWIVSWELGGTKDRLLWVRE